MSPTVNQTSVALKESGELGKLRTKVVEKKNIFKQRERRGNRGSRGGRRVQLRWLGGEAGFKEGRVDIPRMRGDTLKAGRGW